MIDVEKYLGLGRRWRCQIASNSLQLDFIFQFSICPNWPLDNQCLYQLFIIDLTPHYNTLVSNTEVPHISGEDIPFDDVRKIFILYYNHVDGG